MGTFIIGKKLVSPGYKLVYYMIWYVPIIIYACVRFAGLAIRIYRPLNSYVRAHNDKH